MMLANTVLLAQFPSIGSYTVGDLSTVSFKALKGNTNTEVPPWIIPGGLRSYFFADGSGTNIWTSPESLADQNSIDLDHAYGPFVASASYTGSSDYDPNNKIMNWKRNYHGIYSAAYFNHPTEGPVSLGFLHGENKNVAVSELTDAFAHLYQNTIQQNVFINPRDPDSYSGGNPYHEGWEAYNGIISAAWTPNNLQTNWGQQFFQNELGPIAWPATGYITNSGVKCTSGLRHPSSIVYNDSIYIFYEEGGAFGDNIPNEEGRYEGIKVIRVALSDALDAKNYRTYYRDSSGKDNWNPSLPDGFTKEQMLDFVAVKGPKASDIMDDYTGVSQEIRFSVASVRNAGYFIGVEEYFDLADSARLKVALRFSADLVHWTGRALTVYTAKNWNESQFNYPIFLSKDGWSNSVVDIDDFYILGTGSGPASFVNKIHLTAPSSPLRVSALYSSLSASAVSITALYPNPNNGLFQFTYTVNASSNVEIDIFDLSGRKMMSLNEGSNSAGIYSRNLDITALPAGAYLVVLYLDKKPSVYKVIKS